MGAGGAWAQRQGAGGTHPSKGFGFGWAARKNWVSAWKNPSSKKNDLRKKIQKKIKKPLTSPSECDSFQSMNKNFQSGGN
jgi:hypothetical protein